MQILFKAGSALWVYFNYKTPWDNLNKEKLSINK